MASVLKAGFAEKQMTLGPVTLNYVEGPDNGPPLLLIPAQIGSWESYRKVLQPLSQKFHVFAVDVRGHGKSSWTTGDYSWDSVGGDLARFLKEVVGRPAICSGNSSGGILALWLAAREPDFVSAIVLEDAPLFSVEMPRFKEQDRFVYEGLERLVRNIGDIDKRDIADYFKGAELPAQGKEKANQIPDWAVHWLSRAIRRFQRRHPGAPIDIWYLPGALNQLINMLLSFDPDFARAFVDGRFYGSFDHEEALRRVRCPLLILHANWFRDPKWGLVGAMDDADAEHARSIVPSLRYERIAANHVIHEFRPEAFVQAIRQFAADLPVEAGDNLGSRVFKPEEAKKSGKSAPAKAKR